MSPTVLALAPDAEGLEGRWIKTCRLTGLRTWREYNKYYRCHQPPLNKTINKITHENKEMAACTRSDLSGTLVACALRPEGVSGPSSRPRVASPPPPRSLPVTRAPGDPGPPASASPSPWTARCRAGTPDAFVLGPLDCPSVHVSRGWAAAQGGAQDFPKGRGGRTARGDPMPLCGEKRSSWTYKDLEGKSTQTCPFGVRVCGGHTALAPTVWQEEDRSRRGGLRAGCGANAVCTFRHRRAPRGCWVEEQEVAWQKPTSGFVFPGVSETWRNGRSEVARGSPGLLPGRGGRWRRAGAPVCVSRR